MNVYIGQTRSATLIRALERFGFGEMTTRGELPPRRRPYAFDNGCFKDWTANKPFDAERYSRDCDAIDAMPEDQRPDFLVVPDLVTRGIESLDFSLAWAPKLRGLAPLYFVVQDGMNRWDVETIIGDFDGVFVGGSLVWKIRTAAQWIAWAHELGKPAHVGRVGTRGRVRWAKELGADSIDSCLPLWSESNLARFLDGLRDDDPQAVFTFAG